MKINIKDNKGITLIALVVTIIVLIILAGVSISLVLGQDGIVAKAKQGRDNYAGAASLENEQLANVDAFVTNLGGWNPSSDNPEVIINKYDSDVTDDSSVQNEEIQLSINFNGHQKITENTNLTLSASTTKNIKKVQLLLDNVEIFSVDPTIRKIYSKSNIGINDFKDLDQVQKFGDCTIKIVVTAEDNSTKEQGYTVKNYTVGNAACLNSFATTVNGGSKLTGETIIQLKDITTTNHTPIGYLTSYSSATSWAGPVFEGTYDGKFHTITISGFSIPSNLNRGVGIFGNIQNATIKNLTAQSTSTISTSKAFTGGICGNALKSNFNNCFNNININCSLDTVGGIVASADIGCFITKCKNLGNIGSRENVGGICGWLEGTCECSYNTGNITSSDYHVGGIVGSFGVYNDIESSITNCYNTGDITGTNWNAGGIARKMSWKFF